MRYTRIIHEAVEMKNGGQIGKLENALWQFPFQNFEEVLHKANRYSTVGARMLAHKRVSMGTALGHAIWAFIKHYVIKVGFRDGWAGFVIALGNFEGTFTVTPSASRRRNRGTRRSRIPFDATRPSDCGNMPAG